jgi:hypothetical protein
VNVLFATEILQLLLLVFTKGSSLLSKTMAKLPVPLAAVHSIIFVGGLFVEGSWQATSLGSWLPIKLQL